MINCPNCGSTNFINFNYVPNPSRTSIIERIICECGCITMAKYNLVKEETRTANGTLIKNRKGEI